MLKHLTRANAAAVFWVCIGIGLILGFANLIAALPVWLGAIVFYAIFFIFNRGPDSPLTGGDRGGPDESD